MGASENEGAEVGRQSPGWQEPSICDINIPRLQQKEGSRQGSLLRSLKHKFVSRSTAEHRTAIDVHHLARNVACPVGAQEHDGIGHIISQRNTLQRNRLLNLLLVSRSEERRV